MTWLSVPLRIHGKEIRPHTKSKPCSHLHGIRSAIYDCFSGERFNRNSQNNIRTFKFSFKAHIFCWIQVSMSPLCTHLLNWLIKHFFCWMRNNLAGFSSAICSFPYKLKFTNCLLLVDFFFNKLLVHPENVKIILSFQKLHNTHHCKLFSAT